MTARTVDIELDGKTYKLRYPMRSVKALLRDHGVNLFDLDEAAFRDPNTLSAVLWAGLIHAQPDVTVDEVDGLYDLGDIGYIASKFAEVVGAENDSRPFDTSPG